MKLKEYDVVRLLKAVPEHQLACGAIGAVVMTYPSGNACEVEFTDERGVTLALLTLDEHDLEKVG